MTILENPIWNYQTYIVPVNDNNPTDVIAVECDVKIDIRKAAKLMWSRLKGDNDGFKE